MTAYGGKEMAAAFRTVRNNTIQIAQDIPEDKYGWSPAPDVRSIQSLLAHIAVAPTLYADMHRVRRLTTLQGYDFGGLVAQMMAEEAKPRTKAELIALLQREGEGFAGWLATLSPEFLNETYTDPTGQNPRTRLEGLLSPKEHEMHHRGQLMLAQRILGITPHMTRQMMERMAARAAAAKA
ncbi:MAG: DinB family protein [Gemmatimonadaceae bacterium]